MKIVALKDFADSKEPVAPKVGKTKSGKRRRVSSRFKSYKKDEEYTVDKKTGDRFVRLGVAQAV